MRSETENAFRLGPRSPACPLRCGVRIFDREEGEWSFTTPQLALVFIARGRAVYRGSDGIVRQVAAGSFFLRLPNLPHAASFAAGTVGAYVAVPASALDLLVSIGCVDPARPVRSTPFGADVVSRFLGLARRLEEAPEWLLGGVVRDMVGLIAELHEAAESLERSGESAFLLAARAALEEASADRRDLERIAEEFGMNPTTFRLRFARECGEPPGRYRLRRRMEKAAALLSAGHSIAGTAAALGYPDVYAFNAQFRRGMGMPPGRFRDSLGS